MGWRTGSVWISEMLWRRSLLQIHQCTLHIRGTDILWRRNSFQDADDRTALPTSYIDILTEFVPAIPAHPYYICICLSHSTHSAKQPYWTQNPPSKTSGTEIVAFSLCVRYNLYIATTTPGTGHVLYTSSSEFKRYYSIHENMFYSVWKQYTHYLSR